MIVINFNKPEFEYDVHSMVKAYLPKEDVEMYYTCPLEEVEGKNVACTHREIEHEDEETRKRLEEAEYIFYVDYLENKISIKWIIGGDKLFTRDFEVDFFDRKETKNALKQNLYDLLKEGTGRELPWGTLTGIRPTKIPMKLMEEGKSDEEIFQYMKETYFATDEKIQLSIDIAKRERKLLEKIDYENGYSLYIGIPFCPTTCLYCSFTSYPLSRFGHQTGAYVEALKKEIEASAKLLADKRLATVYFGGGTPTALSAEELRDVIRTVKKYFPTEQIAEWTVEAGRPDTITTEKLQMLYDEGISRISINPQTMNQKTLDVIGRMHTTEDICRAYEEARHIGFDNINMDLIIGLTGENAEDVEATLRSIGALSPDSVTVHTLALKRAARLNIEKEQYEDKGAVQVSDMLTASVKFAKENGYAPYYLYRQKNMEENLENVGYARPGKEGLYNILIMEEKHSILALGAGGATKLVLQGGERIERSENVKSLKDYLERTDEMIARKYAFFEQYKGLY